MTLTQTGEHDSFRESAIVNAAIVVCAALFDAADCFGLTCEMGVNEQALIAALLAIPGRIKEVTIATKGGHTLGPNVTRWIDGGPQYIAEAAWRSLTRLGFEAHRLYQHHRPDLRMPYAETVGAFEQLMDDGIATRIGVSNVDVELLTVGHQELGDSLVSVQNVYVPTSRDCDAVLRVCERQGISFLTRALPASADDLQGVSNNLTRSLSGSMTCT